MSQESSRRDVLKAAGGVVAAGGVGATALSTTGGSAAGQSSSEWTEVSSPTGKSTLDVVQTANGPYAVGSSGNVLTGSGGSWKLVIDSGPSTKGNALYSVDVTDDGK
jgi:hypothetical protein